MTPNNGTHERRLHFSIQGEFITRLAREKLYYEYDLSGAVELLMHCLVSPDLTYEARLANALAVLDGTKRIAGVYPGSEYGIYDVPESERDQGHTMKSLFREIRKKLEDSRKAERDALDKVSFVAEHLDEYQMQEIDREYMACSSDKQTIFGTDVAHMFRPRTDDPESPMDAMLQSVIDRAMSGTDEPDYGWLFPDGTFYPVDWGNHQSWAYEWLLKNSPEFKALDDDPARRVPIWSVGDWLSEHHKAILLHSPYQGTAEVTMHESVRITKAQREFLYDYYTKRGQTKRANELYQSD